MSENSHTEGNLPELQTKLVSMVLCEICSRIDFSTYQGEQIPQPINLGTWERVSQHQDCSFCRLVHHCLHSDRALVPRSRRSEILLTNRLSWELGIEISPYDLTGSESYSNKFDLRSVAKRCKHDAYRLLV